MLLIPVTVPAILEHYPTKWNHLAGMIFFFFEARDPWRCGASEKIGAKRAQSHLLP
jgi:hypothetical protein